MLLGRISLTGEEGVGAAVTRVLCPGEERKILSVSLRDKVMIMTREKKEIEFIDHNPHKSIVWGKKNKRHERRNREE